MSILFINGSPNKKATRHALQRPCWGAVTMKP